MGVVPKLKDYKDKYSRVRLEREDGILQMTLHTDGGELLWDYWAHEELVYCLADVGADPGNKVVIVTGSGDSFIEKNAFGGGDITPQIWGGKALTESRQLLMNHLDIPAPMIGAINGPATWHAEIGLFCDIVLAADHTTFQDAAHFAAGLIPGDGAQVVWPLLLGPNRGRYFLLTGQTLTAQEALELGVVNEVMPKADLVSRAWDLAREIQKRPPLTVRLTREAMVQPIKRAVMEQVPHGLALEGLGVIDWWPKEFGQLDDAEADG